MIDGAQCGSIPMNVTVVPQAVNVLIPPSEHKEISPPHESQTQLDIAS